MGSRGNAPSSTPEYTQLSQQSKQNDSGPLGATRANDPDRSEGGGVTLPLLLGCCRIGLIQRP